jgi:hypothetical protein
MTEGMEMLEYLLAEGMGNQRTKSGSGNISKEGHSGGKRDRNNFKRRKAFEGGG